MVRCWTVFSWSLFFFVPMVSAEIRVGLAQVDITPPVGGLTAGYSSAKPTDGVHDPVTARVMVLESGGRSLAMAVCDLCIYNSDDLYHRVSDLGVDQLLLLNTHTHAGPKMSKEAFPSADHPWRMTVDERILQAIREAKSNLFTGLFRRFGLGHPTGIQQAGSSGRFFGHLL